MYKNKMQDEDISYGFFTGYASPLFLTLSATFIVHRSLSYMLSLRIAQWAMFVLRLWYEYRCNDASESKSKLWLHAIASLVVVIPTSFLLYYSITVSKKVPIPIVFVNAAWSIFQAVHLDFYSVLPPRWPLVIISIWSVPEVVLCILEVAYREGIHPRYRIITLLSFFAVENAFFCLICLLVLKKRLSVNSITQGKRFDYHVLGSVVGWAVACLITLSSLILYTCGKVDHITPLLIDTVAISMPMVWLFIGQCSSFWFARRRNQVFSVPSFTGNDVVLTST